MEKRKVGKYLAIGTAVTLTLCLGAVIIAKKCPDMFGKILAVGITFSISATFFEKK